MSLQSWCQNHTIPPMKEDWMEWYMNINKLMRMIINKMKGYLKDDQLGFKYQKSLHKGNKVWMNERYSVHMLACMSQTRQCKSCVEYLHQIDSSIHVSTV